MKRLMLMVLMPTFWLAAAKPVLSQIEPVPLKTVGAGLLPQAVTGSEVIDSKVIDSEVIDNEVTDTAIDRNVRKLILTNACEGCYLAGANLEGTHLIGADLRRADLTGANLVNANIEGADFTQANLTNADLTGAFATNAVMDQARLVSVNFSEATLYYVQVSGAQVQDVNLTNAQVLNTPLSIGGPDLPSDLRLDSLPSLPLYLPPNREAFPSNLPMLEERDLIELPMPFPVLPVPSY